MRSPSGHSNPLAWIRSYDGSSARISSRAQNPFKWLKNAKVPSRLEVEMQEESFFNDGIGIVLFTVMLLFATCRGGDHTTVSVIAELLVLKMGVAFVRAHHRDVCRRP